MIGFNKQERTAKIANKDKDFPETNWAQEKRATSGKVCTLVGNRRVKREGWCNTSNLSRLSHNFNQHEYIFWFRVYKIIDAILKKG